MRSGTYIHVLGDDSEDKDNCQQERGEGQRSQVVSEGPSETLGEWTRVLAVRSAEVPDRRSTSEHELTDGQQEGEVPDQREEVTEHFETGLGGRLLESVVSSDLSPRVVHIVVEFAGRVECS